MVKGPYVAIEGFAGWVVAHQDDDEEVLTVNPEWSGDPVNGEKLAKRIAYLLNTYNLEDGDRG